MNSATSIRRVNLQKIRRPSSSFFILQDPLEPLRFVNKIRVSVRLLLIDEKGNLAYLYLEGKDEYGIRRHYESVGGGIEEQEKLEEALFRELKEETGYELESFSYLHSVIDAYAKFQQLNIHHYYVAKGRKKEKPLFTEFEKRLRIRLDFNEPERWLRVFQKPAFGVDALVHQREYVMLAYFLNQSKRLPVLSDYHKRLNDTVFSAHLEIEQWPQILLHHPHDLDRLKYLAHFLYEAK